MVLMRSKDLATRRRSKTNLRHPPLHVLSKPGGGKRLPRLLLLIRWRLAFPTVIANSIVERKDLVLGVSCRKGILICPSATDKFPRTSGSFSSLFPMPRAGQTRLSIGPGRVEAFSLRSLLPNQAIDPAPRQVHVLL